MHAFVDESVRSTYLLCAVLVGGRPDSVRPAVRRLCRPGQRRFHFAKEGDARRRELLSAITGFGVEARVFTCRGPAEAARAACLTALVADVVGLGTTSLVIEDQDGMRRRDVLVIDAALRRHGVGGLDYRHAEPHEEPLLWVADAVAWAVGRGGDWRRRVEPMLQKVVELDL